VGTLRAKEYSSSSALTAERAKTLRAFVNFCSPKNRTAVLTIWALIIFVMCLIRHAITSLSINQGDLIQIGKFGIGFKSVYAYTNTPRIYSEDEAFCIENYVHPKGIEPVEIRHDQTLFVFPFNHKDVSPEKAFADIAGRLRRLGSRTLLFLNNIQKVDWEINGVGSGGYTRTVTDLNRWSAKVEIKSNGIVDLDSDEPVSTPKSWLIFKRLIHDKNSTNLKVEVAFQLEQKTKDDKELIIPTDRSTLVVFFPTEKETHLKFLIQGPYRTTPARDNIPKDDNWNQNLIEETAILVAEIIPLIT